MNIAAAGKLQFWGLFNLDWSCVARGGASVLSVTSLDLQKLLFVLQRKHIGTIHGCYILFKTPTGNPFTDPCCLI